jgi:hypothetical protein
VVSVFFVELRQSQLRVGQVGFKRDCLKSVQSGLLKFHLGQINQRLKHSRCTRSCGGLDCGCCESKRTEAIRFYKEFECWSAPSSRLGRHGKARGSCQKKGFQANHGERQESQGRNNSNRTSKGGGRFPLQFLHRSCGWKFHIAPCVRWDYAVAFCLRPASLAHRN